MERASLCGLLSHMLAGDGNICAVFDGPPRGGAESRDIALSGIQPRFSAGRPADEVIIECILASTAPRLLTVVSTDREIRAAARRRRCNILRSDEFAPILMRAVRQSRAQDTQGTKNQEPPEKQTGLNEKDVDYWLKEFGLDK